MNEGYSLGALIGLSIPDLIIVAIIYRVLIIALNKSKQKSDTSLKAFTIVFGVFLISEILLENHNFSEIVLVYIELCLLSVIGKKKWIEGADNAKET